MDQTIMMEFIGNIMPRMIQRRVSDRSAHVQLSITGKIALGEFGGTVCKSNIDDARKNITVVPI